MPQVFYMRKGRRIPLHRNEAFMGGVSCAKYESLFFHSAVAVTYVRTCRHALGTGRKISTMSLTSITASTSPAFTVCPSETLISAILPAFGDCTSFCIFIASTTSTPWRAATSSPALSSTRTTLPGIGAESLTCPLPPRRPSARADVFYRARRREFVRR